MAHVRAWRSVIGLRMYYTITIYYIRVLSFEAVVAIIRAFALGFVWLLLNQIVLLSFYSMLYQNGG